METEENGCQPFLEVFVTRKNDGSLSHAVYRKYTHTDCYLHTESHHHPKQKSAVLKTLANQVFHISVNANFKKENSPY